jgi:hypothetical protein
MIKLTLFVILYVISVFALDNKECDEFELNQCELIADIDYYTDLGTGGSTINAINEAIDRYLPSTSTTVTTLQVNQLLHTIYNALAAENTKYKTTLSLCLTDPSKLTDVV